MSLLLQAFCVQGRPGAPFPRTPPVRVSDVCAGVFHRCRAAGMAVVLGRVGGCTIGPWEEKGDELREGIREICHLSLGIQAPTCTPLLVVRTTWVVN